MATPTQLGHYVSVALVGSELAGHPAYSGANAVARHASGLVG